MKSTFNHEQAYQMFDSGTPIREIAQALGTSKTTVRAAIARVAAVKEGADFRTKTARIMSQAAKLYLAGKSLGEVAQALKVSNGTVVRALKAVGIPRREPGVPLMLLKQSVRRDIARELKQQGLTYAEIGAKMGISRQRAQQLVSPIPSALKRERAKAKGRCQKCGKFSAKLDGHHPDYKVNSVVMLCTVCHRYEHRTAA